MKTKTTSFFSGLFLVLFLIPCLATAAQVATEGSKINLETVPPEQVDSILGQLSDAQIRSLLIAELSNTPVSDKATGKGKEGLVQKVRTLLHILDKKEDTAKDATGLFSAIRRVPSDYIQLARKIGNGSFGAFILTLLIFAAIFTAAFLVEFISRRFTADFSRQFKEKAIPDLDGPMRLVAGIMRAVPAVILVLVFTTTAILFFFLTPGADYGPKRYLFLAILFLIVFYRLLNQLSRIFCAPQSPSLRILPLDDAKSLSLHRSILILFNYTFTVLITLSLFSELQMPIHSLRINVMFFASGLILLVLTYIIRVRTSVRDSILARSEKNKTRNWVTEQFATFWHVPTILYFIIIWLIMMGDQVNGIQRQNAAFLMSLLILPLFVIFNSIGQWLVRISIKTLQVNNPNAKHPDNEDYKEKMAEGEAKELKLMVTSGRFMSLAILTSLLIWVFERWGLDIPYATKLAGAIFETLIIMALGLVFWRFASSYIERKIAESTPEKTEEEDSDDEWGAAADRGRSYTLLPMLRKVLASTLLVMVTLLVLSATGMDIGPLLAGAGVLGLAIGFGAQKLVSDVFSGFFYLLDDAFRVGEYIEAGSVSGAVEAITLRNVMLRHHRGMLQIVPHSDLGSITNFMRGGIIVKFNLEFPYDANVDKIRKVIKKVGKAMMADEEFAKDFINPVKSAGVREITGSVMVIRVKFKAQPGTHFVIRREAYRRITEALAAQGIHYAHRKVIVELPEQAKNQLSEQEKATLMAGAAAEITQQEEDTKNNSTKK